MKSEWEHVTDQLPNNNKEIMIGDYVSYWFLNSPRRLLHYFSYYKFASKMIGKDKEVLDVGCNEGLGTYLLAKECGYAKGIDSDTLAIENAKKNFGNINNIQFETLDFFNYSDSKKWDAIVSFDVIEHILPEKADDFLKKITLMTKQEGLIVIGTPSYNSQKYASEITKKGHVNIYTHERLECELRQYYDIVFILSANDEVIHTGFYPMAHYYLAIACKKKNNN